jgi:hypothetical protein
MAQKDDYKFEIELENIFSQYNKRDIKEFVKDLFLIFRVLRSVDREYSSSDNAEIEHDVTKFKSLIKEFNRKYRDILFEFYIDGLQCALKIYFAQRDYESILPIIKQMNRFIGIRRFQDHIEGVYENYNENNEGENCVILQKENNMLRMIFQKEDMLNAKSPEFRLCTYFAMKDGFEKSINLQKFGNEFSFQLVTDDAVEQEHSWDSRYFGVRYSR